MGKLSRDTIPKAPAQPCKVAGIMLDSFDAEDFALIGEELAAGRTMASTWEWLRDHLGDRTASAFNNHLKGRCRCADDVPLKGVRRG